MSKTNNVHGVARRSPGHRAMRPSSGPQGQGIEAVARRVERALGGRDVVIPRVVTGAVALGAAAVVTAGVLERQAVAKAVGSGLARAAELGRSAAITAGLVREPLYRRALPGLGIAAGLLAAGAAAFLLVPRFRASAQEAAPGAEHPSDPPTPWDPADPHLGTGALESAAKPGTSSAGV